MNYSTYQPFSWAGGFHPQFLSLFFVLLLWELYWKGRGLWQAARNKNMWWFIAILVINSLGLLPIIYLYFFQPKTTTVKVAQKARKRSR